LRHVHKYGTGKFLDIYSLQIFNLSKRATTRVTHAQVCMLTSSRRDFREHRDYLMYIMIVTKMQMVDCYLQFTSSIEVEKLSATTIQESST